MTQTMETRSAETQVTSPVNNLEELSESLYGYNVPTVDTLVEINTQLNMLNEYDDRYEDGEGLRYDKELIDGIRDDAAFSEWEMEFDEQIDAQRTINAKSLNDLSSEARSDYEDFVQLVSHAGKVADLKMYQDYKSEHALLSINIKRLRNPNNNNDDEVIQAQSEAPAEDQVVREKRARKLGSRVLKAMKPQTRGRGEMRTAEEMAIIAPALTGERAKAVEAEELAGMSEKARKAVAGAIEQREQKETKPGMLARRKAAAQKLGKGAIAATVSRYNSIRNRNQDADAENDTDTDQNDADKKVRFPRTRKAAASTRVKAKTTFEKLKAKRNTDSETTNDDNDADAEETAKTSRIKIRDRAAAAKQSVSARLAARKANKPVKAPKVAKSTEKTSLDGDQFMLDMDPWEGNTHLMSRTQRARVRVRQTGSTARTVPTRVRTNVAAKRAVIGDNRDEKRVSKVETKAGKANLAAAAAQVRAERLAAEAEAARVARQARISN